MQRLGALREGSGLSSEEEELQRDGSIGRWIKLHFTPKRAVFVLTFVLFLNYVDRGIVAGAATSIKGCVASEDLCLVKHLARGVSESSSRMRFLVEDNCTNSEGCRVCGTICNGERVTQTGFGIDTMHLGMLQSSFMIGLVAGTVVFAHLSMQYRPFRLVSLGLVSLVVAAIGSGLSNVLCESDGETVCWYYYLMIAMRALSGLGEASVSTLALPFLDDVLDAKSKGMYVGIYCAAIPVGTAFGFMWAGLISDVTSGAWQWAFFIEALFVLPFALLAYHVPTVESLMSHRPSEVSLVSGYSHVAANSSSRDGTASNFNRDRNSPYRSQFRTLYESISAVLSKPAYLFGAGGYAIYTGVIAGVAFFGPTFIQNFRPTDPRWNFSQADADVIFGFIVSVGGLLGTLLGGWFIDRISRKMCRKNRNKIIRQLSCQITVGILLCLGGLMFTTPTLMILPLFLGCTALFMVTPGINLMLMWAVPKENRPMGSALCTVIIHTFGDVPSPILIGYMLDISSSVFAMRLSIAFLCFSVLCFELIYFCLPEDLTVEDIEDLDRDFEEIYTYNSFLETFENE